MLGLFYTRFKEVMHLNIVETGRYAYTPFDDGAAQRLLRMGLTLEDGQPDRDAVAAVACMFAGQFFDDLCDYYQNLDAVRDTIQRLMTEAEDVPPKRRFLLLCLQYDAIYHPLPDPMWWLSGNPKLVDLFSTGFLAHLEQLMERSVKA